MLDKGCIPKIYTLNFDDRWEKRLKESRDKIDGIDIIRFRSTVDYGSYHFSIKMFRNLLKEPCDIIHGMIWGTHPVEAGAIAAKANGIPYFITPHGFPHLITKVKPFSHLFYDRTVGKIPLDVAEKIIISSGEELRFIKFLSSKNLNKCVEIPNAIWTRKYDKERDNYKEKLGISDNEFLIACISRMDPIKGIIDLVKAVRLIDLKDLRLVIAGPINYPDYFHQLIQAAKNDIRIHFIDRPIVNKEKIELLNACDIFCLPTKYDSQSIALIEAMACGKPVISTKTGGIQRIVLEGETGLLARVGDISGIANRISLIYKDRKMGEKMGKKGRDYVLKNHDWSKVGEKIYSLYMTSIHRK